MTATAEGWHLVEPPPDEAARYPVHLGGLLIEPLGDVLARVRAKPPRQYLLRGIWAQGSYGVLSAEDKAGKTWAALDMAVSVASGTPWMGVWPVDQPGPVVLFLGEGGEDKVVRRLEAIARAKGTHLEALPLHLAFAAPCFSDVVHLGQISDYVAAVRPALVIVDPLYLAAAGAKSSDLYAMGAVLGPIQRVCEPQGTALLITHHWNKGGSGTGHDRSSGVGPGAWGRTNVSMSLTAPQDVDPDTRQSTALLRLEFQGDEVSQPPAHLRRVVSADDPDDLGSALHYAVGPASAPTGPEPSVADLLVVAITEDPGHGTQHYASHIDRRKDYVAKRLTELAATGRVQNLGSKQQPQWHPAGTQPALRGT